MKTIGLIGGMSWESTAHYYALLNKLVKNRLGGYHSAKLLLYSIDFDELAQLQSEEKWHEATTMMVDAARRLERGGADCVLLCANTMHIAAEAVEKSVSIPLLHIADATGRCILAQGLQRVGLLGTAFTMEREFYKSRLHEKFGLNIMVPEQRRPVHDIIFKELVYGVVNHSQRSGGRMGTGLNASGLACLRPTRRNNGTELREVMQQMAQIVLHQEPQSHGLAGANAASRFQLS